VAALSESARDERVPPRRSLRQRLLGWRNRLLADQRFQRFAAAFPPTRGVAARRARDLFDIGAGFVYAQILLACVELRLFEVLAEKPLGCEEVARRIGLPAAGAERLLRAAAALDLVEMHGPWLYGLGTLGAAFRGNPGLAAMIEHHRLLYADLADPVALLRGERTETRLTRYWAYARAAEPAGAAASAVSAYSSLMTGTQGMLIDDVLEAAPLSDRRALLDIGGGEGAFLAAVAARHPHLSLTLFDLPPVVERARVRLAGAGLDGRLTTIGGDFTKDGLPPGHDVITLVRVLHDHDDDVVVRLLAAVRAALPRGGRIVVAEPMSGVAGAEPVGDAYFGFYLLAMGQGRPRRAEEIAGFLARAGFARPRALATRRPLLAGVVVADTTT